MRTLILATSIVAASLTTALANQETRARALSATAAHLVLAHHCELVLDDPSIYQVALDEAELTLAAGGYEEAEAAAELARLRQSFGEASRDGFPADYCQGALERVRIGRPAFRAELLAARNMAEARQPALFGRFVAIAQRRASGVAAPLSQADAAGGVVNFGTLLTWLDGTQCMDWQATALPEVPFDISDPMLSDVVLGPLEGPTSDGDRRLMTPLNISCGERELARVLVVDPHVLVVTSPNGGTYTVLEKPLTGSEVRRFQTQLKDMKFYLAEPTGVLDEPTRSAAAAYAEYRGAAYRFEPVAIAENLLDGLGVLGDPASAEPPQAALGFNLLEALQGEDEGVMVSPASVAMVLAYLHMGADPAMRDALLKTLSYRSETDLDGLRQAAASLSGAGPDAPLKLANALFTDNGFEVYPAMRTELAAAGMQMRVAELTQATGVDEVNHWVGENTGGLIGSIMDRPLPAPGMVAINALHFRDGWRYPFPPARPGAFRTVGGGSVDAQMMRLVGEPIACRQDEGFAAAVLPYNTEGLALVVITTTGGAARLAEFAPRIGWLMGEFEASTAEEPPVCVLTMPKFGVEARHELLPVLGRLGLDDGMSAGAFAGFSAHPVQFSGVTQHVVIGVDETGTEAAAATATTMVTGAYDPRPPLHVEADKPFLFALVDRSRQLLLLAGYVGNPLDQ